MNRFNEFFRKVYSSPSLIWKGGAGLLFLAIGLFILFEPQVIQGLGDSGRYGFSALLCLYGVFRLGTFYIEYKNLDRE